MNKDSECLVSVLRRYDYRSAAHLAKMYFGANWQECRNFYAFKFGEFCFLYATVDDVAYFGFLPIDVKKPVVTEKQFDELVATLKQFPKLIYRSPEQGETDEHISFNAMTNHLFIAGYLFAKGILQKKWIKRHMNFLIANSENHKKPVKWIETGAGVEFHYLFLSDTFGLLFFLRFNADLDQISEDRMIKLQDSFSKNVKLADYIYFPYSDHYEPLRGEVDVAAHFRRAVEEAIKLKS